MGQKPLKDLRLMDKALVAALGSLLGLVNAALAHLHVGEDQLQIDDVDVPQGIGAALDVGDVAVVKAAYHMDDGVGGADVGQELVAQTLALGRAFDQTRNIDELDDGGGKFFGIVQVAEPFQPLIRHGDDAHVGVDGAESVVVRGDTRVGDGVKQGRLAHIGQTDDTELHSTTSFVCFIPLCGGYTGAQDRPRRSRGSRRSCADRFLSWCAPPCRS